MSKNQLTRADAIRMRVDRMLLEDEDLEDRRCGYVHLYGVGMAAAMIALRRGRTRAEAELMEIAGLLHDCASYRGMKGPDHARDSAEMARAILTDAGAFGADEIETLCHAIRHHSEKDAVGTEFDEILKDADVMQHWLLNPMGDGRPADGRVRKLIAEFHLREGRGC